MGRKQREVPASLVKLERRFVSWRRERPLGERIPERLWRAAAKQAAVHGVSQTSSVLKVSYYSLKEHFDQRKVVPKPAFVEVLPPSIHTARECVITCEDGTGTRMRVQLKGYEPAEVLAWGRTFFGERK